MRAPSMQELRQACDVATIAALATGSQYAAGIAAGLSWALGDQPAGAPAASPPAVCEASQ